MLATIREHSSRDDQLSLPMEMPLYCIRNRKHCNHRLENFERAKNKPYVQLTFFNQSRHENVLNFVPLYRYPALDIHVHSELAKDPRLTALTFALADRAITRVGHLVQLTRTEVLRLANASEAEVDQLEFILDNLQLKLNSRVPQWKKKVGIFHRNW